MSITRRHFLKMSAVAAGAATATPAFGGLGFDLTLVQTKSRELKTAKAKASKSVCCYCAVGCGLIVSTDLASGRCINTEGDPDHPINEGALCPKGASIFEMVEESPRVTTVLYRAPHSDKWEEKSWDWALPRIARKLKDARDASFQKTNVKGQAVNRTLELASVGSAAVDNEEGWLHQAMMRALGLVYIDSHARICHSSTVGALAESFGRGAMTNHWIDIKNSDVVLIMGSNAAENHPISFHWVTRAMASGAKLIHVDPRFTRTSSKADIHAHIRSGTDIAFFGGLMLHIIDNKLYQLPYVSEYTNASLILNDKYSFQDGLFSGYDEAQTAYDRKTWAYEYDEAGIPRRDPQMEHPRCVLQLMRAHYARYNMDTVSGVTGIPKDKLKLVWDTFAATGKPDKAGSIMYAMGQTQHTVGVQNIRALAMIQLLLGNIGVAGGGVNALRGESNVQGTTDHALIPEILPGYLAMPKASLPTLADYLKANTPVSKDPQSANWWSNYPKYTASYLKSVYPGATPETAYEWHPKVDDVKITDYMWLSIFDRMSKGGYKGLIVLGQNPAAGGANAGKNRKAMGTLDFMVAINPFHNETSNFWRGPGVDPKTVKTEVFFLPACLSIEKEGSVTNSGRWMQWREAGPKPMGQSKSDGDILLALWSQIRALYAKEAGAFPEPVLGLYADYQTGGAYDSNKLAKMINGVFLKDATVGGTAYKAGSQTPNFTLLADDGSTACGNWLYSGSYTEAGNLTNRHDRTQTPMQENIGLFPNWTWAWPLNRRILYNRASTDPAGKPTNPKRAVINWTGDKWEGDVPDGGYKPGDKLPFIMLTEGRGHLFGPGRVDGPLPEHYEPMESPLAVNPFSSRRDSPTAQVFAGEPHAVRDPRFPYVCTTYRVTEQWQSGSMTRQTGWLRECQPQGFCELSRALAGKLGVENGDQVILESLRGLVQVTAMVTERMQPFTIMGETVHEVGIPWQFGWMQPNGGKADSANLLSPSVGDPNTGIPETKAFMVNVRKA
ncbi:MAG: formate dehydrogenase-N subunit alpha [Desulfovibrionaceae bacterium]|nr:formate dehydrogenase-N subunit alpha [Desulfovibrionaceae bacterium]MBF0514767.1 formate dehydrogenase-N subunit alpha [Desulfovibrionaceae bacterium]